MEDQQGRKCLIKVIRALSGPVISLLLFVLLLANCAAAQQQFTQTVTAQNRNCNATCSVIDIPQLSGDPGAILFITPAGGSSNPHPIGAYYMYLNQWSVFNLDAAAITVGSKFNVEYYAAADANNFVYIVPTRTHTNDPAYIDHAGLNGNPNAQIRTQPHVTSTVGNHWNKEPVKVEYDPSAAKWFIANVSGTPITPDAAYNVSFSSVISAVNPNTGKDLPPNVKTPISGDKCDCIIPTSLPPNGNAGGDLGGSYPNPSVQRLQGKPVSNVQPKLGQILKWGIDGWEPADNSSTATATSTRPSVLYFNQSDTVSLDDPNVNVKSIVGLDNKTFTLSQSGRIVFSTRIDTEILDLGIVQGGATSFWLNVEILNASNAVVAKSSSHGWLAIDALQTMNSTGIGLLPAGTYHTRVSIHRQVGGRELVVFAETNGSRPTQGGQMIIEVFPDL